MVTATLGHYLVLAATAIVVTLVMTVKTGTAMEYYTRHLLRVVAMVLVQRQMFVRVRQDLQECIVQVGTVTALIGYRLLFVLQMVHVQLQTHVFVSQVTLEQIVRIFIATV
jgi:hypothetical protein